MHVSSAFDGGNIEVEDVAERNDVRLRVRPDAGGSFMQWFHFRVAGAAGQDCVFNLTNAGEATYAKGFEGYQAVASYDRQTWFRVQTSFDGQTLTIRHTPERDQITYAYFAPYSMERHADLIARCLQASCSHLEVLGRTVDGQDIEMLRIGEWSPEKVVCWAIARQHPGETMAEYWMEGFLGRLLDPADAAARRLLSRAVFFVVPNMNPDGSRRGHLRTNAASMNLNRVWDEPSAESSPEVFHVRRRMYESNVGVCIDVHGEEVLPHCFIAGFEGIPNERPEQRAALEGYKARLAELNPDFQTEQGYPPARPGQGNLNICTNFLAERFGAVAMTLEMPFKDTADAPMPETGWSPARSRALGRSSLNALRPLVDRLA